MLALFFWFNNTLWGIYLLDLCPVSLRGNHDTKLPDIFKLVSASLGVVKLSTDISVAITVEKDLACLHMLCINFHIDL